MFVENNWSKVLYSQYSIVERIKRMNYPDGMLCMSMLLKIHVIIKMNILMDNEELKYRERNVMYILKIYNNNRN